MEWRARTTATKESLGRFSTPFEKEIFEILPEDPRDEESCMVLAGDIGSSRGDLEKVLDICSGRFPLTVYVPGNHEFWYNEIQDWKYFRDKFEDRPDLKISSPIGLEGYRVGTDPYLYFLTGTMWSDCAPGRPLEEMAVAECFDFAAERYNGHPVTIHDYRRWTNQFGFSLDLQLRELQRLNNGISAVVTHHLPSYSLCDPRYNLSKIDGLFAANHDGFFGESHAPNFWIHGHTHHTIDRILGDKTRVLCNPVGYPSEYTGYNMNCFVDLGESFVFPT